MKNRWILNLLLLITVAGLVAFLYLRPQTYIEAPTEHAVSQLKLADFTQVKIEFPTKAAAIFDKVDGYWRMSAPHKARADQGSVQRILSIIAATSAEKFSANDLEKFGLNTPALKIKLTGKTNEEFIFGTHNPVTDEQYMAHNDAVYLITGNYAEAASTQAVELIDKSALSAEEAKQVTGFDFSRLEQWAATGLKVNFNDGKWLSSLKQAKLDQNEMNEWFDFSWKQNPAKTVELYNPDRKATLPSFEIKLKNGKKIHFDKIQESPELLIGRPDEGIIYHFSNDAGFTMLNPPLNIK